MRYLLQRAACAAAALVIALGLCGRARADVYLSLGDSVGFGIGAMPMTASYGTDQGYTGLYAADLASRDGGVTPTVMNLSVPGETISSFFGGSGRVGPDNQPPTAAEDLVLVGLNKNYTTSGGVYPTQNAMLLQALGAYGPAITHVTISLGSDDLFKLALTDPNAAADLPSALGAFASNLGTIVGEIKMASPNAQIILVGSYNPYPPGVTGGFADLAGPAITALNQTIAMVAAAFPSGVWVANTFDPFAGNQLAYTYISQGGNVHPNAAGYQVVAGAIEAVPEPSAYALTAVGAAGIALIRRARKAAG